MVDVEILLEPIGKPGARQWRVEVRSLEPTTRVFVEPLVDVDLADIAGLPAAGRTWAELLRLLSPNATFSPPSHVLRAVGERIMVRVLGHADVARHLDRIEARARQEHQPLRILLEILEDEDPVLARLPLELAHDGARFFFKRTAVPSLRCSPYTEVRDLHLAPGARVLIATAHADHEPAPDRASLLDHAEAIARAVRSAGFEPEHLPDATTTALRDKLLDGPRVDILYIACHGLEDRKRMGQLVLRDKALLGEDLGRWLEEATELGKQVQLVALCACSSAAPQHEAGTSGMAQWLVRQNRALATLGFRAPVLVSWALRFSERLFERLGTGAAVEDAFAHARFLEPDGEPQWPLALLYGRRRERVIMRTRPGGLESVSVTPLLPNLPPISPPLPRQPRAYFTGRARELAELRAWVLTPGAAQITAVEGQGGIGKSELACVIAREVRGTGRPVVWLERADKDLVGAMGALIRLRTPGFQAAPETSEEDLAAILRRDLGPYRSLLVLDDIADRTAVDRLTPSGEWNVLVTTRLRRLLPGSREVEVRPLELADALMLLSRVAWDADAPPDGEGVAAMHLVERLPRLPLALELAGATLRNLVTAEQYLAELGLAAGIATSDSERVQATLLRSLSDLEVGDKRVFLALGILPAAGATGDMVAITLSEPAPPVVRRLDRLVRHNLATWSPEIGRYLLHPLLREAAVGQARVQTDVWAELHRGAAAAIEHVMKWVYEPVGSRTYLARERWANVCDIFDALEPTPWIEGAPGGDRVAMAIASADMFRYDRTIAMRDALLTTAVTLSRDGHPERRANVLLAHGGLRLRRADLVGAGQDYDAALSLFEEVENRLGQAYVLKARGELRLRRDDLVGAGQDYDAALALYQEVKGRLGQANVLLARGNLRLRRADLVGAVQDFDTALSRYEAIEDRLGQANVLQARGDLERGRDDLTLARIWYEKATSIYRTIEAAVGLSNALAELAWIHTQQGDGVAAEQLATEALELASRSQNSYATKLATDVLAQIRQRT